MICLLTRGRLELHQAGRACHLAPGAPSFWRPGSWEKIRCLYPGPTQGYRNDDQMMMRYPTTIIDDDDYQIMMMMMMMIKYDQIWSNNQRYSKVIESACQILSACRPNTSRFQIFQPIKSLENPAPIHFPANPMLRNSHQLPARSSHLGCTFLQPLSQVLLGDSPHSEEIHLGPMHLKLIRCGRTAREVS